MRLTPIHTVIATYYHWRQILTCGSETPHIDIASWQTRVCGRLISLPLTRHGSPVGDEESLYNHSNTLVGPSYERRTE